MPRNNLFLTEQQRKEYIDYFEKRFYLNEERDSKRAIMDQIMGHIFLARELVGYPSRMKFLDAFWKLIEEGAYGPVDWEYVESQHTDGVFMSEIVTYEYTEPYLYAICALIAFREFTPQRSIEEIDEILSNILGIFRGISWGHGIERPYEARRIVSWLAAAGAFPLDTEKGYLEVIAPIYEKLIRTSEDTSGMGDATIPIFRAGVLLNLVKLSDLPSETYNQEFLDKLKGEDPSIFWVLKREIENSQLLSMLENKRLPFEPITFPWHAVSFNPTLEDLDKLKNLASDLTISRENEDLFACLLKLEALERK